RETSKLAANVARNPRPRIKNDLRAPTRPTKKPALALIVTIRSRPTHVCGLCRGASPLATFTTNAACSESIRPARQTTHASTPASKARLTDTTNDFQENVFKVGARGRGPPKRGNARPM